MGPIHFELTQAYFKCHINVPLFLFGLGAVIDQNFELWSFNFVEALRSFTLRKTQQYLFVRQLIVEVM